MSWTSIFNTLQNALSFENVAEDRIQWMLFSLLCSVFTWFWRVHLNNWKPNKKGKIAFWVMAPIMWAFLLAFASSMRGSKREVSSAIRGTVTDVIVSGFGTNDSSNSSTVTFLLELTNPGQPSVAWNWTLITTMASGEKYVSVAPKGPLVSQYWGRSLTNNLTLRPNAYLPNVMLSKAIGNGDGIGGWTLFKLEGIRKEDVARTGTRFQIQFEQSDKTIVTLDKGWSAKYTVME